ncbi:MAG: hypothetical protein Q7S74_05665 [Nanoarchaeota archaeon]|nr:hypothetical protein [Nanoarchaeota archaeon]
MIEGLLTVEDFLKGAKPTNIAEDVRKQVETFNLLKTYDIGYVIKNFSYVIDKYGFTEGQLREMMPRAIEEARHERWHNAAVAELMPQVVGAEVDEDLEK